MTALASFHLLRERPGRSVVAMARLGLDRPVLARTDGLAFWKLLGTGRGSSTGPAADLRRTALFALWRDPAHLDRFEERMAPRWERLAESYHLRLAPISGHGAWKSTPASAFLRESALRDSALPESALRESALRDSAPASSATAAGITAVGPASDLTLDRANGVSAAPDVDGAAGAVVVLTRAVVRVRHLRTFAHAAQLVDRELADAPGLLAVCGIGEAPIARQATFSIWRSASDLDGFARRRPHHVDAVRRTRREGWYGEELFMRFSPLAHRGTWDGRDPLIEEPPGRSA